MATHIEFDTSFRFVDERLNRQFVARMKQSRLQFVVDDDGTVYYSSEDEARVEKDVLSPIRTEVFSSWQILSCPENWAESYVSYMRKHRVPFRQELINHELCFLIPGELRPHSWRLPGE